MGIMMYVKIIASLHVGYVQVTVMLATDERRNSWTKHSCCETMHATLCFM